MSHAASGRLKVNPPIGRLPVLTYMAPAELQIDATYQRSLETRSSQALIRRIATFWDWGLCQPLVVARRPDGGLYVIDGQHRLEGARQRNTSRDPANHIPQLPCVILDSSGVASESAKFVHLNQERRPLTKLELFKAAVASEDPEALAIVTAMTEAGLSIAPHSNYTAWKPGMVSNLGGIESAWRTCGSRITGTAMRAMAMAYADTVLRYGGTIWPGIVAVCADEMNGTAFDPGRFEKFVRMVADLTQGEWRKFIARRIGDDPDLKFAAASQNAFRAAWDEYLDVPAPAGFTLPAELGVVPAVAADGKRWCNQCDMRVELARAASCRSPYCTLRKKMERAR